MLSVEIFLNNTTHGTISKVETMLTRRDILKSLGLAPAALPFLGNLSVSYTHLTLPTILLV